MSIFDKIANYLGTPVKEVGKQFQRDAQASLEFPEQSIIRLTNASQAVQGGIEDASVWAINKEKELGVPEGIANLDALPSVISRMALPQTEEETGAMLVTPLVNPLAKFMVEEGAVAGKGMYQGGKALVDKIAGHFPTPPSAMEPALAEGISAHTPVTDLLPAEKPIIMAKELKQGDTVYRGAPTGELGKGSFPGTFITNAKGIAKQYGPVHEFKVPKDLNLLDSETEQADRLALDFFKQHPEKDLNDVVGALESKNPDDRFEALMEVYAFPDKDFSTYIKSKGYDGFITSKSQDAGNEFFIFDNTSLQLAKESIPKPYAPPFYSYLEQSVNEKMPNRMAGKDLQGLLTNAAVKKEELQYSGMDELFEKPMVTKQEVLDHLQANKIELKELENGPVDATYAIWDRHSESEVPLKTGFKSKEAARKWADNANIDGSVQPWEGTDNRKFAEYQLPGGKNYKEMLFQLPKKEGTRQKHFIVEDQVTGDSQEFSTQSEVDAYLKTAPNPEDTTVNRLSDVVPEFKETEYQSSHFDEPNVLAHTRFNEVKDAQGKKVLRIEEIQSDWHQTGRDEGYVTPKTQVKVKHNDVLPANTPGYPNGGRLVIFENGDQQYIGGPVTAQEAEQRARTANQQGAELFDKKPGAVPDAPFKKNWHEMVMRRMIRYAAENGFDKVAWTTGEQQAKRYPGLIKAFDAIRAELKPNGTYDVYGAAKDQLEHRLMGNFPEAQLTGAVGKDLAQKIVQQKGGEFTGLDLKVGDHGMKVFYDEMLLSYVNKFTKKWGGKVVDEAYPVKGIRTFKPYEKEELKDTIKSIMQNDHTFEEAQEKVHELLPDFDLTEELYEDMLAAGRDKSRGNTATSFARELIGMNKENKLTLHTLTLTPEMKRAALTKGFPLFSGAAMLNYLNDGKEEKKKGVQ